MNKYLFTLLLCGFLSSCVPNKDLVYIQDKGSKTQGVEQDVFKPYRVQLGDLLKVQVKSDLEGDRLSALFELGVGGNNPANLNQGGGLYFNSFVVDNHGNIRVPLIGDINVLGYTTDEIRLRIEEALRKDQFTENANIYVDVRLAGFPFTVNGEVSSTGTKTLFQDRVTILEAIAAAGDITLVGNRKEVTIIRRTPTGSDIHMVDLTDREVINSPYYYIQPNDYIYIKPLPQKSWGTGATGSQTLSTIIAALSLLTTTILLTNRL